MLLEHLRGSDALLVLDNCEHVVDEVAVLVPRLLAVAPECPRPVHQPGAARDRR